MTRYIATPEGTFPMTAEQEAETDAREEAGIAASAAGYTAYMSEEVRRARNQALTDSDYRAATDLYLAEEWRDYRQALRDLPEQPGFPEEFFEGVGIYNLPEPPSNTEVITREQAIAKGLIAND